MENLAHSGAEKSHLKCTTAYDKIVILTDDALLSNRRDLILGNQLLKLLRLDQTHGEFVWEQISKFEGLILDREGDKVKYDEATIKILFSSPAAYWLSCRFWENATGGEITPPSPAELPLLRPLSLAVQIFGILKKRDLID